MKNLVPEIMRFTNYSEVKKVGDKKKAKSKSKDKKNNNSKL
jgi:hypothetical protein